MNDIAQAAAALAAVFTFAVLLALVNERLIEKFVKPLLVRFGLDQYVDVAALVTGALVSAGFGIDLFSPLAAAVGITMTVPWAGIVLSALVVGGGSNLLHDIWPSP